MNVEIVIENKAYNQAVAIFHISCRRFFNEQYIFFIKINSADELGIVIKKNWQAKFYKRFALKGLQVESDKDEGWAGNQLVLLEILGDPEKGLGMKLYTYAGKNNDIEIVKELRKLLPSRVKSDNSPGKEYNNTRIKWKGDIDDEHSQHELLDEIKIIMNSKKMQELFAKIKTITSIDS